MKATEITATCGICLVDGNLLLNVSQANQDQGGGEVSRDVITEFF